MPPAESLLAATSPTTDGLDGSAPLVPLRSQTDDDDLPTLTLSWRGVSAWVPDAEHDQPSPQQSSRAVTHSTPADTDEESGLAAGVEATTCRRCMRGSLAKLKRVLVDCWGDAHPGELLALMGPSGAGKTTLLNVLAQRPTLGETGSWRGQVLINGRVPPTWWRRAAGYCMQRDIFFEELSVIEHLRCTAMLQLPASWSREEKMSELERVMHLVQLSGVRHSRVGSETKRGLSGGELKRLNIATELLAKPRILFLDEPLTGLDSALATAVLEALRQTAQEERTTVMLTVHQPSSPIWGSFDKLMLMAAGGRTTYFGPCKKATEYFASLGHECPISWNPPDYFIELVSDGRRDALIDSFLERNPKPPPPQPTGQPILPRPRPSFFSTTATLLQRAQAKVRRSYLQPSEWYLNCLLAVVFGLLWWQVGGSRRERQKDYISIIFFFVAQWSWAPLFTAVNYFPAERNVLTRERASDSYEIGPWYVAKVLSELPISWLLPAGFCAICYPMVGMPPVAVPTLFGITMLNVEVASSLGYLISAIFFDRTKATTCAIVAMVFVMCAGGYFVDLRGEYMPKFIQSFRYISFWYYTLGLYVHYALPDPRDRDAFKGVLGEYSFSKFSSEGHPEFDVLALIAQAALARFLAYLVLRSSRKLEFS